MKHLPILPLTLTVAFVSQLSAQTTIYEEDFSDVSSVDDWREVPTWSATEGNPDGSVIVSNNNPPGNQNYTIDIPLALVEDSDLVVSFDAKSIENFAGVFHFYAEPENNPQFFIKFNNEADITESFSELTFNVDNVPASASFITLRFEMVTGAEAAATVSVAIDNLLVTGPSLPVEGEWEGYPVDENGWVDTGDHLGFINVVNEPWYFSFLLDRFFYVADPALIGANAVTGSWMYMTK